MQITRRQLVAGSAALGASWTDAASAADGLDGSLVDRSLALGTRFMLASQKAAGNFEYELDWHSGVYSTEDHPVRQAGAAWGLALIHQDALARGAKSTVRKALGRALKFFARCSKTDGERRYVLYPGFDDGAIGTVALVALAHIELLRVEPNKKLAAALDGYLAQLLAARLPEGRFHGEYDADGAPHGRPSPYYDGEALLALVKAARYLGRDDLMKTALAEADAGYQANVVEALADEPDSAVTKGYYQWSSMAYYELATRKKALQKKHARRLLRLADWMLDVHTLHGRTRNTAYAYEGIVPAQAAARLLGDEARAEKYGRAIERGLRRLCTWQVGSPIANEHIRAHEPAPPAAVGGVQNHRREPLLRIDVTQHQMHALMLARRLYLEAQ